jgi:hypothetical protein
MTILIEPATACGSFRGRGPSLRASPRAPDFVTHDGLGKQCHLQKNICDRDLLRSIHATMAVGITGGARCNAKHKVVSADVQKKHVVLDLRT